MLNRKTLALAASVSLAALAVAGDALARGGGFGGHFGGGFGGFGGAHFGGMRDFGGARDFRPEFRPEARPEFRPEARGPEIIHEHPAAENHDRDMDRQRADDGRDEDRRADQLRDDDARRDADHAADRDLDRDAAARDRAADRHPFDERDALAHSWNDLHHPVNVGRWDHNAFWNNAWNGRDFRCPTCRWGWVGPVFWPFAWGDVFSFAWWPYGAAAPFWNYNIDYILGGVFWPYGAYAWPSGGYGATAWTQSDNTYSYASESHQDIYSAGPANEDGSAQPSAAAADEKPDLATCGGMAPGVPGLPIDKIQASVQPHGPQLADLKDLEMASAKASVVLDASCPRSPPLTPVGRLDALQKRLGALVQALDLVRSPLTRFDASLSTAQRADLDALGGGKAGDAAKLCSTQNEEFVNVPTQEIIATIDPDEKQQAALDRLDDASAKAARMLQQTCPADIPSTTEARLDAMSTRLQATVTAMNEVRPALVEFYDSLSDEQKARFDTMPGH